MRRYQGFTLIETLAATTLAAMMMVTIVAVVSSLMRDGKLNEAESHTTQWDQGVREIIHRDLRHAEHYYAQDNMVTVSGHISLDPETFKPSHQPATVSYKIVELAGTNWLLRTQADPDSRALDNEWTQLMCSGVQGITIKQDVGFTDSHHNNDSNTHDAPDNDQPLPDMLSVPCEAIALLITWGPQEDPVVTAATILR